MAMTVAVKVTEVPYVTEDWEVVTTVVVLVPLMIAPVVSATKLIV